MENYKRFWVDEDGEYYRVSLLDWKYGESGMINLPSSVPNFISELVKDKRLRLFQTDGIIKGLSYYKDAKSEPVVAYVGDAIIQPTYDKDAYVVPGQLFNEIFHGQE